MNANIVSTSALLQALRESELFDPDWYLAQNADAALSGLDPAVHFLRVGARLGRAPGPNFDVAAYRAKHVLDPDEPAFLHALRANTHPPIPEQVVMPLSQRIRYLLPVSGGGGGAHSVVQDCKAMRDKGVDAAILVWQHQLTEYTRIYADIEDSAKLFEPFTSQDHLNLLAQEMDVVVATLYSCVKMLMPALREKPNLLLAYYIQDYEPLFFEPGTAQRAEAEASYSAHPGTLCYAKTNWICDQVSTRHGVCVHKITPAIDHRLFHPAVDFGALKRPHSICAMLRPATPRRGAQRTADLFRLLLGALGDQIDLHCFGCSADEPEAQAMLQGLNVRNHGVLLRPQVADLLRKTDIFVDMSDYQGFGRSSAEAMACGALALVPAIGGAVDFAEDGLTALVCDTFDVRACAARLTEVIAAPSRLATLRLAGLRRVQAYCARASAMDQLVLMAQAASALRGEIKGR